MNHAQTHAGDSKPTRKRISLFKAALIILGLLLALTVIRIVWAIIAVPTISVDYVAKFSELTKPVNCDPNENAAASYEAAFAHMVDMPAIIDRSRWPQDMNEADLYIAETLLTLNSKALGLAEVAASMPYYWVRRSSSLVQSLLEINFPEPPKFRTLACCVDFQIKFRLHEGKIKEALESIETLHKMGVHLCATKSLIEQVLGMRFKSDAVRFVFVILDRHQVDTQTLKHLQQRLIYQILQSENELDFRGDKLLIYDIIQRTFTDNGREGGFLIPRKAVEFIQPTIITLISPPPSWFEELYRKRYLKFYWASIAGPGRRKTVKMVDKYFQYADTLKQQTPWQLHLKGLDSDNDLRDTIKGWFAKQLLPRGYYSLIEKYYRYRTEEYALLATIAILRYKAEKGQLPDDLEQLVSAGYLRELPMDPYSDGSLVYKRVGDDFVLYSVGADFDDDGGVGSDWGRGDTGDQVFWPVERPRAEQTRLTERARRIE
jgi:hypothetical protein